MFTAAGVLELPGGHAEGRNVGAESHWASNGLAGKVEEVEDGCFLHQGIFLPQVFAEKKGTPLKISQIEYDHKYDQICVLDSVHPLEKMTKPHSGNLI